MTDSLAVIVAGLIESARCLGVAQRAHDSNAITYWDGEVEKYRIAALEVGAGGVVVPMRPTAVMIGAACDEWARPGTATNRAHWAWDAMIAAAPKASEAIRPWVANTNDAAAMVAASQSWAPFTPQADPKASEAVCAKCNGTGRTGQRLPNGDYEVDTWRCPCGTTPQADPAPSVAGEVLVVELDKYLEGCPDPSRVPRWGVKKASRLLWKCRDAIADHARMVAEKDAEIAKLAALRKHHRARHKSYKRRAHEAEQRAEAMAGLLDEACKSERLDGLSKRADWIRRAKALLRGLAGQEGAG